MPERTPRSRPPSTRPLAFLVLVAALGLQGLSGVAGGLGLALDPSGASVGLPLEWLEGSPFPDYGVPGIVLLTLLGILPLAVAWSAWTRRSWSWAASLGIGLALVIWLLVEIAVVGYQPEPPLQLVYGILAAIIVGAALTPSTRAYLSPHEAGSRRS